MMPSFSAWDIGLLALLTLLLVGPKQLPKLARSIGASIRETRGAIREIDAAVKDEPEKDGRGSDL